jgi:hypothetical protein
MLVKGGGKEWNVLLVPPVGLALVLGACNLIPFPQCPGAAGLLFCSEGSRERDAQHHTWRTKKGRFAFQSAFKLLCSPPNSALELSMSLHCAQPRAWTMGILTKGLKILAVLLFHAACEVCYAHLQKLKLQHLYNVPTCTFHFLFTLGHPRPYFPMKMPCCHPPRGRGVGDRGSWAFSSHRESLAKAKWKSTDKMSPAPLLIMHLWSSYSTPLIFLFFSPPNLWKGV